MLSEFIFCKCDRCGSALDENTRQSAIEHCKIREIADEMSWEGAYLFASHSRAIRAMEIAGWRVGSPSVGGDTCERCIAAERWDENANGQIDDARELANYAGSFAAFVAGCVRDCVEGEE